MTTGIRVLVILSLNVLNVKFSFAQLDTLISYDVRTQQITVLPCVAPDSVIKFDSTGCFYGTVPGFSPLDTSEPTNTYMNSGSTDYTPAHLFFPVSNYPLRAAVKLFRYAKDTLSQECSGMMVEKDLVLTSAHCLHYYFRSNDTASFQDSMLVVPAYDDGEINPEFGESVSESYILPKADLVFPLEEDIALIKLRDPIGIKTGWIGIALPANDSIFKGMVLHQFSYPGVPDPFDSTKVFNGDTMYYNYGAPTLVNSIYLGYVGFYGVPGQSGSSIFYTDNINYYSFGVAQYAADAEHYRIDRNIFYAFKNIIDQEGTSVKAPPSAATDYVLYNAYPNPFNPATNISFSVPRMGHVTLTVYDILGRTVTKLVDEMKRPGKYIVRFDASGLASGVYFYRIESEGFHETKKMLFLK
ncbi:MAG TPA: T9SS type A sorting domain-containing protein [Candidatus Acidoferrales bacterium]|nr:T9SS type A sorting domain-containing protein [Candidatus Acidoferrales bacterium]